MPTFSSASSPVLGTDPTVISACEPLDRPAVGERDDHAVAVAAHRLRPCLREDLDAALGEHVLQHRGGVGVLAGEHPVAAGDERDPGAHLDVRRHELRAGHARPDDDQVLGQLGEVVELTPGEDALAVGLGVVEDAGGGAGGDEDDVGREDLAAAVGRARFDGVQPARARLVGERGRAPDDPHALALDAGAHVGRLGHREARDARVDPREVDAHRVAVGGEAQVGARPSSTRTPAEAMSVLEGTQSSSTQAPPMPSRSTTVTSPPCWAATSAAS